MYPCQERLTNRPGRIDFDPTNQPRETVTTGRHRSRSSRVERLREQATHRRRALANSSSRTGRETRARPKNMGFPGFPYPGGSACRCGGWVTSFFDLGRGVGVAAAAAAVQQHLGRPPAAPKGCGWADSINQVFKCSAVHHHHAAVFASCAWRARARAFRASRPASQPACLPT